MTLTPDATPDESGDPNPDDQVSRDQDPKEQVLSEVAILTLPADSSYVAILRTTTAGITARLGFGLDVIEDLRIGVDEACTLLLSESPPEITCRFDSDGRGVTITMSMCHDGNPQRWRDTFAWQVLTSLTDRIAVEESTEHLAIQLRKDFV